MKKIIISFVLVMSMILSVLLPNKMTGNAVSSDITYITNDQKTWTITFNKDVKASSVNDDTVNIKDEDGNKLATTLKVDGKKVTVQPKEKYVVNKPYTLNVTAKVLSEKTGKALKAPVVKKFVYKEANKMNEPIVSPSAKVAIGSSSDVFYVTVKLDLQDQLLDYNEQNDESSVVLYKKENGNWVKLHSLFDDGDLYDSKDEIKGDGYYSADLNDFVPTDTLGAQQFKIEATLKNGEVLAKEFTITVVDAIQEQSIYEAQQQTEIILDDVSNNLGYDYSLEEVTEKIVAQIETQQNVSSVKTKDNAVEIVYDSGVKKILNLLDENSNVYSSNVSASNIDEVTDGDVLVWSPNSSKVDKDFLAAVQTSYQTATTPQNVTALTAEQATLDSLKNMTDYGTVILNAQSFMGNWLATKEYQTSNNMYLIEQTNEEMATVQDVYYTNGYLSYYSTPYFVINEKWFENNLENHFDNSIIVNTADKSAASTNYWDVFAAKGAGAYLGFEEAKQKAGKLEIVEVLVKDLLEDKKLKETSTVVNNNITLFGNDAIQYNVQWNNSSSILNGGFEEDTTPSNKVPGWNYVGDGRVINSLGNLVYPVEGSQMGLISTGLGFTENLGQISQTFQIQNDDNTLSFNWNYLSEEFLEYIGTGFDDPFTVKLQALDNSYSDVVLDLSVNKLAQQFKAGEYSDGYYDEENDVYYDAYENGGGLMYVSPEINFDRGDVWMTDWQQTTYTIPEELKGKVVKLVFSAQDAQDSIYDTAVLVDDVKLTK